MTARANIICQIINAAHYAYKLNVELFGLNVTHATVYLTDNNHNVTRENQFRFSNGRFTAMVEPRAMKTFFLEAK